jgi:hypothetical protein
MNFFPIYDVTGATRDRPEALGTKEKFWLIPSPEMGLVMVAYLFKIGRPGTGENWAEKVCCEILHALEIPRASYDFAKHENDVGVVSKQFVSVNGQFLPANMLLESAVKGYDGRMRFRQRKYQLSTSLNLFKLRSIEPPSGTSAKYAHLSAAQMFIGYVMFDVLVGNTDRHHENWGLVIDYSERYNLSYELAPTFDHASCLGRNESDEARSRRLLTRDRRDTVEAYANRARSAFFASGSNNALLQTDVLEELIRLDPEATTFWADVFSSTPEQLFNGIFARIDPQLISREATQFALRMLNANSAIIKRYT